MSVGLHKSRIVKIVLDKLGNNISPQSIAEAVAAAIDKNNEEIEEVFKKIRNEMD